VSGSLRCRDMTEPCGLGVAGTSSADRLPLSKAQKRCVPHCAADKVLLYGFGHVRVGAAVVQTQSGTPIPEVIGRNYASPPTPPPSPPPPPPPPQTPPPPPPPPPPPAWSLTA